MSNVLGFLSSAQTNCSCQEPRSAPSSFSTITVFTFSGTNIHLPKSGNLVAYLPYGSEDLPSEQEYLLKRMERPVYIFARWDEICRKQLLHVYICPVATDICPKKWQALYYICPTGTRHREIAKNGTL